MSGGEIILEGPPGAQRAPGGHFSFVKFLLGLELIFFIGGDYGKPLENVDFMGFVEGLMVRESLKL